ncbi:AAA family ATPase, partial [Streptomyces sp. BE303]|nr:AAA family ATPase [Streptomyces sp. BE303]
AGSVRDAPGSLSVRHVDGAARVEAVVAACRRALLNAGSTRLIAAEAHDPRRAHARPSAGRPHRAPAPENRAEARLSLDPATLAEGRGDGDGELVEPPAVSAGGPDERTGR